MEKKIRVASDVKEHSVYAIGQETGQFYVASLEKGKKVNAVPYAVGLVLIVMALRSRINAFYIPRATVASNTLLLSALIVVAIAFYFWVKRYIRRKGKKIDENEYQAVSLTDEKKKYLLKKSLTGEGSARVTVIVLILLTVGSIVWFLMTSDVLIYMFTGLFFLICAFVFHIFMLIPEDDKARIAFIKEHLAQYEGKIQTGDDIT